MPLNCREARSPVMKRKNAIVVVLACAALVPFNAAAKTKSQDNNALRDAYVARIKSTYTPSTAPTSTTGSLWSDQNPLNDMSSDYKAHRLNETVTILVSVQSSAAQSGSVDQGRDFSTTSALTGIFGKSPVNTNPIFAANSSQSLKGKGATSSSTVFQTSLTGTVIAVLQDGDMIVEAQRKISMNNQKEDLIVRGMLRPGDIGPGNVVPSTALSNLEIEMKGKGVISDGVRPPNKLTRALLWLFNF